ncbi:DUF4843 domain-containing protein [Parapedobacter tibetensis]|uniref:DUF4843 domain-containing protein n=1 Tax=Parapedobacter tibetensis TaxID=2972951 RepID=UPI00214DC087|nr:DUF4843 domain-containing protein [Parapedobacter tibetensis]
MKHVFTLGLALLCLARCTKDEIDLYGNTDYLCFADSTPDVIGSTDIIEYSFAFNPGAVHDTIPVFVKLVGNQSPVNRPIALTVDAENTTALEGDFELPHPLVFRAGLAVDTLALVLHHSEGLQQEKRTLRLTIHENEHFKLGPLTNRYIDIHFSDMIARPAWWNNTVTTNFLGAYSDTKYRLFIEATGIADMGDLSENEQRAYAVIFRDFLARGREQGEIYEDEHGLINVSPNLT